MNIEVTQQDGFQLAVCDGPLDDSTHRPFRDVVHPLFTEKGVRVVVDLLAAKWINSEGIAAMVRLVSDANTRGCHVVFARPNAFVSEVLQVTRLDKYFDMAPTHDEATTMLNAGHAPSST